MSTREVKRQRSADMLHVEVYINLIAETVGASVSTVYNAKNRIRDIGGIYRISQSQYFERPSSSHSSGKKIPLHIANNAHPCVHALAMTYRTVTQYTSWQPLHPARI